MDSNRVTTEQLEHLKQRKDILDEAIASLERLAAGQADLFRLNLAPTPLRLYKCADRGYENGRVRRARGANAVGANFR